MSIQLRLTIPLDVLLSGPPDGVKTAADQIIAGLWSACPNVRERRKRRFFVARLFARTTLEDAVQLAFGRYYSHLLARDANDELEKRWWGRFRKRFDGVTGGKSVPLQTHFERSLDSVVRNELDRSVRLQERHESSFFPPLSGGDEPTGLASEPAPDETPAVEVRDTLDHLLACTALTDIQREVVKLFRQGLGPIEVAERLGFSPATVGRRYHEALAFLREWGPRHG